MNRIWIVIIALIIVAPALPAQQSADPIVITMDTAVNLALRGNLGIEIAGIDLDVKRRNRDTVWNYFVPRMSLGASLARMNEAPSPVTAFMPTAALGVPQQVIPFAHTPAAWNLGARFEASLSLTLQMYYGIRATLLDYELGLLSLEATRRRLERDVGKSFLNLLLLDENIKLMEKNISTAKSRFDQATANFRSGLVDEYTMLSAQVVWMSMTPVLEEMRNGRESLMLSFKTLLGLDFDTPIRLSGTIEPELLRLNAQRLIRENMHNNLNVRQMTAMIRLLDNLADLQASALYPILTFGLSVDPTFLRDPFQDPWFDNLERDWRQRSGMFSITLSLPLDPLLPDSKARVETANARAQAERQRMVLAQTLQAVELEIRTIVLQLEKSEKSLGILEMNLRLAEKANRMGQEAFRAGLRDFSQIETTELELQRAQYEILKERFNYAEGLLDLAYALNTSAEKLKEAVK